MTGEMALDILLDALKDSALVFAFVFLFHVLLSFFEAKLGNFLAKRKKTAPLFGSLFGLIPQCGTSVLGADLYIEELIGMGTVISIFLSCSDEAVIVLLVNGGDKTWTVLPLLGLKFVIGCLAGFLVEVVLAQKQTLKDAEYEGEQECHKHHHENTKLHAHLIHPLLHSLELFAYVLLVNLALGFLIGFVGEDNFVSFMTTSKYLGPVFGSLIGLIPNCASSVLLSELFINSAISFGTLASGLLVNSGLGIMVLLRKKQTMKKAWIILGICFGVAVTMGYLICLVSGF